MNTWRRRTSTSSSIGDYIYEYISDGVGGLGGGPVRVLPPYPSGQQTPQDLADYRHLYQTYRADVQQQAMHETFAMIQLWDDHEFMNDCHQDFHEDTPNPGENATTPKPLLRQAANQAWWEQDRQATSCRPGALGCSRRPPGQRVRLSWSTSMRRISACASEASLTAPAAMSRALASSASIMVKGAARSARSSTFVPSILISVRGLHSSPGPLFEVDCQAPGVNP
jgi:hypothetical protein